ncbi:MAG TPA: histidine phosphatase family protein [Terriglobales bacterium]|jgi:phosphohistidine phosphatase SixA
MIFRVLAGLILVGASCVLVAQDAHVVFFVRHAEKVDDSASALLNAQGLQRAKCLADTLHDAHITAIYATDVKRTQQTATPTAAKFGLNTTLLPKSDSAGLVAALKQSHGNVLVVNHSDTLPGVVKAFSGQSITPLGAQEYDRLIEIEVNNGQALPAVVLHYCPSR